MFLNKVLVRIQKLALVFISGALIRTAAGAPQAGAAEENPRVRIKLLADTDSVAPGGEFRLGLLFEIDEHWHIYWRNPGDAGLPPKIEWELPEGFSMEPLQWPLPLRLEEAGGLYVNAYKDRVLLFARVHSPESLGLWPVTFRARAVWLVCSTACVQERAQAGLALPVSLSGGSPGESTEIFETFAGQVPRAIDDFPLLNLSAYWLEAPRSGDDPRIGRIILESGSDLLSFLPENDGVQWFDDPSEYLYSGEIRPAALRSNSRRLVLELPVWAVEELESWPGNWGGVLRFRMKESEGDTLDYSLVVKFADTP